MATIKPYCRYGTMKLNEIFGFNFSNSPFQARSGDFIFKRNDETFRQFELQFRSEKGYSTSSMIDAEQHEVEDAFLRKLIAERVSTYAKDLR